MGIEQGTAERLEAVFEDAPQIRDGDTYRKFVLWEFSNDHIARLGRFTMVPGFEDGVPKPEWPYPRLYKLQMVFPNTRPTEGDPGRFMASSFWRLTHQHSILQITGVSLNWYGSELNPFEQAETGNPDIEPGRQPTMYRDGLFSPYIFDSSGVEELLDTYENRVARQQLV
jgi:hypothetical protein